MIEKKEQSEREAERERGKNHFNNELTKDTMAG